MRLIVNQSPARILMIELGIMVILQDEKAI